MKIITVTELRANIYQLIDHVIATGEPILIRRKGKCAVIALETHLGISEKKKKRMAKKR